MFKEAPLITVILAVYNGAETLQQCIDSVAGQTYAHKEFVVMDGGSTDGSADILRDNHGKIAYWESEKDRGIFHAWNKAVDRARGEWICFLGSDDYFWQEDVLERMIPHLEVASVQGVRVVYPQLAFVSAEGELIEVVGQPWEKIEKKVLQDAFVPHPGTMHHRSLFEIHGRYDESFRAAADHELLLRELKSNRALFASDIVGIGLRVGGVSTLLSHQLLNVKEVREARRKNGIKGFSFPLFRRQLRALSYLLIQRLVGIKISSSLADFYRIVRGKRRKWNV